ncbi:MAG: metallophosphoesterase family protein [Myxococcota bacterium]
MIRPCLLTLALVSAFGCARQTQLRVAVIGDFGGDNAAEAQVAAMVAGWTPDLVVTVGDDNYPSGAAETIDRNIGKYYAAFIAPYRGAFGPGGTVNRFFPTLGNHDWGTPGAQPYLDYFELPGNERYYELERGSVALFFLDSDRHEPDGVARDSAQARWLRDALARSTAQHKWVLFHHPPYSSGPHGSTAELQWPFRAWGATAVFSGHDHDYERLEIGGMPYAVVGTGGMGLYAFREPLAESRVRIADQHGALRIDVTRSGVEALFVSARDGERDRFALPPSSALPVPAPLVAAGSGWRVRDGVEPPATWLGARFDTTDWASAETPFRIVDRGAAAGAQKRTTYYRTEFDANAPESLVALELGLPRDQPATAYLNGREVARLERSPEREAHWLVARGPRAATAEPILVHRWLDPHGLAAGTNVLAIAIEREPEAGGDPSFAAELVAYPRTPP